MILVPSESDRLNIALSFSEFLERTQQPEPPGRYDRSKPAYS